MSDDNYEVFNPKNRPLNELPYIIGFNNGGGAGFMSAIAIAEDGNCLGSHMCSHEYYMPYDLGILKGHRKDRHENDYQRHYPDGYRMTFVSSEEIDSHELLNKAFELNVKLAEEAEADNEEK